VAAKSFLILLPVVLVVIGCSSAAQPASQSAIPFSGRPAPTASAGRNSASQYIQHVVIIIQENRSFENFFAGYPGANAPLYGYAKRGHRRVKIELRQTTFETESDLPHNWQDAIRDWDKGKMDGFLLGPPSSHAAYTYMDHSEIAPYWTMAKQYVLADALYPTELGGSYTAHLTAVAGTDNLSATVAEVNFPTHPPNDCDAPAGTRSSTVDSYRQVGRGNGPFPCFTQFNTMAELLDTAGISWKYYVTRHLNGGIWSPFEAISYTRYSKDWNEDVIAPGRKVLSDVRDGNLASVSWVTPTVKNSDHPGAHSDTGPSWVTSIVNEIGESQFWNSSAVIVIWDDWGGLFDNAPPPQLDFRGLGIRVPCLIISPYAKTGYVSHVQYEFGSLLRFIEEVNGLTLGGIGPTSEGYTDGRANSLDDAFDFTQSPRKFSPIHSKYPATYFLHGPSSSDDEPVDPE
jgi:phospholipase C